VVADHLTDLVAPMPALASAADATKSLRIGTFVLNNDLRHPVLVAREAAAIDLLSDGRFELGLGAGSIRAEYDEAGLRFDRGATRVERLAEAVAIIKPLLRGERVSFPGRHYRVDGHVIGPPPAQKPHPPLLLGGNGTRLLDLAGREADIVGFTGISFQAGGARPPDLSAWAAAEVDARVRVVREAAGERFSQLELNVLVQRVIVTGNRVAAAEELATRWPQLAAADLLQSPYVLIGTLDEIAEELRERRERWGFSYYVVRDVDAFAPVVARLAGT